MKVNRCIHCMQEMGEGAAVCPCCGKGQEYPLGYDGLRPNTILHGRYLTGLRVEENTYIAFDLAEGRRMSVKEFYPRSLAWREGNVVVPYHVPGEEWAKGLEEFLRLGNALLQQPPDLNLPRVLEVFQGNGTAYIALCEPVEPPSGDSVYDNVRRPTAENLKWLLRRADESLKSPGGFDPEQNVPQVVYGPPPQEDDVSNACPSCGFRWESPAMLPKPKFCVHCGKKLPGGAG